MNKDIRDKTDINADTVHLNDYAGSCTYCKGKKKGGFKTWGFNSYKTRVDDYEIMTDRGWRRCGKHYYKTDLKGSCCQLYTIRLKVSEFKLSYKQRKALNKFNRFLNGELEHKLSPHNEELKDIQKESKDTKKKVIVLDKYEIALSNIVIEGLVKVIMQGKLELVKDITIDAIKNKIQTKKSKDITHGNVATNAALVLFNFNKKLLKEKKGVSLSDVQKAIIEQIESACSEQKFKIAPAQNGFINFIAEFDLKTTTNKTEKLSSKPDTSKLKKSLPIEDQKEIKKEENKQTPPQYTNYFKEYVPNTNSNPVHKYTVEIVPAMATQESFEVFKLYEEHIHGNQGKNMESFKRFLCNSSLYDSSNPADVNHTIPIDDTNRVYTNQGIWPKYLGSYHMLHRIDGKLIAVGVLDFTKNMVSSVYFFYDPAYKFLNLGIVGALREIEYVRNIQENYAPSFEYYYLGYYIQDCIKSVYKSQYYPSYLLCPETYTWVPLEEVREKITKEKYARLASESTKIIDDMNFKDKEIESIMNELIIISASDIIPFAILNEKYRKMFGIIISKLGKNIIEHIAWTM